MLLYALLLQLLQFFKILPFVCCCLATGLLLPISHNRNSFKFSLALFFMCSLLPHDAFFYIAAAAAFCWCVNGERRFESALNWIAPV
jgi:hypothetical protein